MCHFTLKKAGSSLSQEAVSLLSSFIGEKNEVSSGGFSNSGQKEIWLETPCLRNRFICAQKGSSKPGSIPMTHLRLSSVELSKRWESVTGMERGGDIIAGACFTLQVYG